MQGTAGAEKFRSYRLDPAADFFRQSGTEAHLVSVKPSSFRRIGGCFTNDPRTESELLKRHQPTPTNTPTMVVDRLAVDAAGGGSAARGTAPISPPSCALPRSASFVGRNPANSHNRMVSITNAGLNAPRKPLRFATSSNKCATVPGPPA